MEPISLPIFSRIPVGEATVYGWGTTSPTEELMPDVLQAATKPILDWNLCREIVNTVFDHEPLHSSNLCTTPLDQISACQG